MGKYDHWDELLLLKCQFLMIFVVLHNYLGNYKSQIKNMNYNYDQQDKINMLYKFQKNFATGFRVIAPLMVIFADLVVCRKLFKKSSFLKPLDQLEPNLDTIIFRVCTFKIVSAFPDDYPTWPPWL